MAINNSYVNPYTGQNINLGAAPSFDLLNQVQGAVDQQSAVQGAATQNPFINMAFQRTGLYSKLGLTPTGGINPMLQQAQQRLNNWNPFLQPAGNTPSPMSRPAPANAASNYQTLFQPASHQSQMPFQYF